MFDRKLLKKFHDIIYHPMRNFEEEIQKFFPQFKSIRQHSGGLPEEEMKLKTTTFFEAFDTDTNQRIFIKRVKIDNHNEFKIESEFFKKYQNERTVELLYEILENDQDNKSDSQFGCFVLPFAERGDLYSLAIDQLWSPSNEEFLKLAFNLLTSLSKIHSRGCILRDIKLDNIGCFQIRASINVDSLKFMDFGSAYIEGLSKANSFKGTENYYAPEYFYHGKMTPAYDIWSLGVTFYTMIAKCFPTAEPPNRYYEYPYACHFSEENIDKLFEATEWEVYSDDAKELIKMMLTYDGDLRPSAEMLLEMSMFDAFRINHDDLI